MRDARMATASDQIHVELVKMISNTTVADRWKLSRRAGHKAINDRLEKIHQEL